MNRGFTNRLPGARSADFQICCIAGFKTRATHDIASGADLEIGDTAGLETCATAAGAAASQVWN